MYRDWPVDGVLGLFFHFFGNFFFLKKFPKRRAIPLRSFREIYYSQQTQENKRQNKKKSAMSSAIDFVLSKLAPSNGWKNYYKVPKLDGVEAKCRNSNLIKSETMFTMFTIVLFNQFNRFQPLNGNKIPSDLIMEKN